MTSEHELLSPSKRLEVALAGHLNEVLDDEGRSPLHLLLPQLRIEGADKKWDDAVCELIENSTDKPQTWWRALEGLISMSGLDAKRSRRVLEQFVREKRVPHPRARASAYNIIIEGGEPLPADVIAKDLDLKAAAPLLWLDLILPLVPDEQTQQGLIYDAVSQGHLKVADLDGRLTEVRRAGGKNLGQWISKLRGAFPQHDRGLLDNILSEIGVQIAAPPRSPGRYERLRQGITRFGAGFKETPFEYQRVA